MIYIRDIYITFVDDYLMFSPSKDKCDDVFALIQKYFKIEDHAALKKFLGIDLDRRPDGQIHISQPYLNKKSLI